VQPWDPTTLLLSALLGFALRCWPARYRHAVRRASIRSTRCGTIDGGRPHQQIDADTPRSDSPDRSRAVGEAMPAVRCRNGALASVFRDMRMGNAGFVRCVRH